ncbi:type II toxin-antitoxin system HicB family antitoxin [Ligilactobacillus animalis]|jgi:predicted RNase H-like HicB family nuclease|uniref:type II toxin-antitoxin system HicB family antitoxin n=1 Tax=Ligilactobacillus animalis TaxID=1605 RepID=UPI002598BAE6|nr:type II toxin-antitoxin system HicB family antitoxin [Ligilactobacillus animalis]
MTGKGIVYPIIVSEYDDDGHYFVATSPNIPGMVTQGDTLSDVVYWAEDAIATMIAGEEYPTPQDPTDWPLKKNERVVFVSVNMVQWLKKHSKTVRKNITIPDYLNDWAVENNVNVSRITTEALMELADI